MIVSLQLIILQRLLVGLTPVLEFFELLVLVYVIGDSVKRVIVELQGKV